MRKVLLILAIAFTACNAKKEVESKIGETVKNYLKSKVTDVHTIDAIYYSYDTVTPRGLAVDKSINYLTAYIAIERSNPNEKFTYNRYKTKYEELSLLAKKEDSTTFVYWFVKPIMIYTAKDMQQYYIESRFYVTKDYHILKPETPSDIYEDINNFNDHVAIITEELQPLKKYIDTAAGMVKVKL